MAQAKSAEALTHAAKAQFDEAKGGARQQDKDTAQAQVRQEEAVVAEVTAARIEVLGLAPSSGEVSKRLADIGELVPAGYPDRKSTRLNSSHVRISYAVFYLK